MPLSPDDSESVVDGEFTESDVYTTEEVLLVVVVVVVAGI